MSGNAKLYNGSWTKTFLLLPRLVGASIVWGKCEKRVIEWMVWGEVDGRPCAASGSYAEYRKRLDQSQIPSKLQPDPSL
jgi:hypothetical protein